MKTTERALSGLALVVVMSGWVLSGCVEDVEVTTFDAPCAGIGDAASRAACLERHGVRVTFLHTSDWHSRLLPYDLDVLATDERLGLLQSNEPFGGIARAAHVLKRERANANRVLHVDSGDCFQGAPIFNEFLGEAEILAMNEVGVDAFVIGNHEFDNGVLNLYDKLSMAQFPTLAANYRWRPTEGEELAPLTMVAKPFTVVEVDGVRVGVIGMANFSSLSSISYGDSGLGITVLESQQVVQEYVDLLRPNVNIVTVLTHLGLGEDEEVIRNTDGVDIVFGGHLHVVLNPPKFIPDRTGRMVPLVHSGAFLKYVGRLDTVFAATIPEEPWNLELLSHDYEVIPIDRTLPEDAKMAHLIAPFERELARRIDLRKVIGYTPQPMRRFGPGGGDSPLGNFLANAMMTRERVEADIAATNSLGIRADINRGGITIDQMYNVFPFPNTITTMTLSGNEVQELLDFNTYRSSGRGCATQLQVAGVEYQLDCDTVNKEVQKTLDAGKVYEFEYRDTSVKFAKDVRIIRGACEDVSTCTPGISACSDRNGKDCGSDPGAEQRTCRCRELLQPEFFYKFATNNYMARGGSGFRSLRFNTTQYDTGVDLREAVIEAFEQEPSCQERCEAELGAEFDARFLGRCAALESCRQDLGAYEARWCDGLHMFSDQDECLEAAGASRCTSLRDSSELDLCLVAEYADCRDLFFDAEVAQCRRDAEAREGRCAGKSTDSPKRGCVLQAAPQCGEADRKSEYQVCIDFVREKASLLCPRLPCPEAESENRQKPIRPRNDPNAVGGGGGEQRIVDPVTLMEALQAEGHDACY